MEENQRMQKITVFSCGDSTKLATWSNVPFLFCRALEKYGFEVRRVNIEPLPWLNKLYNRISYRLFFKLFKSNACPVFGRSRLNNFLTERKIKKAVNKYSDSCLNLFLTYNHPGKSMGIPNVLWCDWPDEVVIQRLKRSPKFYEKHWLQEEEKVIKNADLVYSLFPVCAENMSKRYTREVVYLNQNVVNTICEEKFDLTEELIKTHYYSDKLLFIGNYNYHTAALQLIEQFLELQKEYPSLELHIIGMTEAQLNISNPRITCYGYLHKDNPEECKCYYALLQSAKVIVNPAAQWGAFSSIAEAMYYGIPVVISPYEDFAATFGEVIDFGYYLTGSLKLKSILQKIIFCQYEEYRTMSTASHSRVAHWTWDDYVKVFCDDLKKRGILQ